MPSLDVDRSVTLSPTPYERGALPPSCSLSLTHIKGAREASQDNGVTLMFVKKNLTDVGVSAVQELAGAGGTPRDDEGKVER